MLKKENMVKKDDRIIWHGRKGIIKNIDTSAQETPQGRAFGWPFAAWVLFDDAKSPDSWACVLKLKFWVWGMNHLTRTNSKDKTMKNLLLASALLLRDVLVIIIRF